MNNSRLEAEVHKALKVHLQFISVWVCIKIKKGSKTQLAATSMQPSWGRPALVVPDKRDNHCIID